MDCRESVSRESVMSSDVAAATSVDNSVAMPSRRRGYCIATNTALACASLSSTPRFSAALFQSG